MIDISYDVPVPKRVTAARQKRPPPYPYAEMKEGGSFFVAGGSRVTIERQARRCKPDPAWRFRVRQVTEDGVAGTRCWRVK